MHIKQEIIFIDSQVSDLHCLVDGVIPGINVIILEASRDGIAQITEVLREHSYSHVHLVAHGSPGCLYLGNSQLKLDNLDTYKSALETWFIQSLSVQNLLIYGCNVAAGDSGAEFIAKLNRITRAEIAASTTLIGNSYLGGDWHLDYQTTSLTEQDQREDILPFSQETQQTYAGILAVASSTITTPDNVFIGAKDVEFSVTFDNTGVTPGYGPFTLLYLDTTGADGADTVDAEGNLNVAVDDGLTFKSAQYLGVDLAQRSFTFNAAGQAIFEIGTEEVTISAPSGFGPGDTVVYLELPFGSFVPDQPPADIAVTVDVSNLADKDIPLNIQSQSGYKFGDDPLDNADTDPIIFENIGGKANSAIAPELVKITKNYLGPEDETSTGPNYVRQYEIVVDIAPGQTINNLDVTDLLPDTMQFVDVASIEIANSDGVNSGAAVSDVSTPDDGGLTSIGSTNTTENDLDSDGIPTPGGTLTRRFDSITGGNGEEDIVITVDFYVPRLDAQGDVIINANSGDDVLGRNQSQLGDNDPTDGNNIWDTQDDRDANQEVYIPAGDPAHVTEHVLEEQSISIQKSVANADPDKAGFIPGDVLTYTLDFQVSDYFAFEDIIVNDSFSDGQRFNTEFTPLVTINEQGGTSTGELNFTFNNYTPSGVSDSASGETLIIDETDINNIQDGSGNTLLTFNISEALIANGLDGQLIGGAIPQGGFQDIADLNNSPPLPGGATTGTITFQTIVQDEYSDDFLSNDASVDQSDLLDNGATINGAVLDVLDPDNTNDVDTPDALIPTGQREDDDTAASISISDGTLHKSIYAINGIIAPGADIDSDLTDGINGYTSETEIPGIDEVELTPGDTVTYRLTYELPTSDVEEFQLTDYFPLPVFDVGTEFADSTFSTTFDLNGGVVPAAGETHYGPLDTFHQITGAPAPSLSFDAEANTLNYNYGDFDDPENQASVVDLLVTVTTENDPFADDLLLTNQVRESQENTFNEVSTRDAIIQIALREPELSVTKGVVAHNSIRDGIEFAPEPAIPSDITFTPGEAPTFTGDGVVSSTDLENNPIDSNLTGGLQVGDIVTFAIVVENVGGSRKGVFDTQIQDTLPDGFDIPTEGLNLNIKDGTGADLTFTGLGDPDSVGGDLFGNGIEIDDPGATPASGSGLTVETDAGGIDAFSATSGRNIAIISYDLEVNANSTYVDPGILENTARVVNYSNLEGGDNFLFDREQVVPLEDTATVEIEQPEATKEIVATSEAHTPETGDGSDNANAREATIGEIVRYRLVSRIPEGSAVDFVLKDNLPNGHTFLNDGTSTVAFVSNGDGVSSSTLGTITGNVGNESTDASNFVELDDAAISSNANSNEDDYTTGKDVYFKLGDIVNGDRDIDDEFVVIEFNALVDNNRAADSTNDAGDILNNNFQIIVDGNVLDTSNNTRVQVVEPQVAVDKLVKAATSDNFTDSINNVDAQDIVNYSVTFNNSSSNGNVSTAFDVVMADTLPDFLELQSIDSITWNDGTTDGTGTGGTLNLVDNSDLANNEISFTADTLPQDGSVTVNYTAQVLSNVNPNLSLENNATVSYTSLPNTGTTNNPTGSDLPEVSGAINGERDGSDGTDGNPNDYTNSDTASIVTTSLTPVKSLVETSAAFTGATAGASENNADLTIGEIARYRLAIEIPEGLTNNLQISDLLPDGLRYLDDGTSKVAFVSEGGLTSDLVTGENLTSADPNITPVLDITAVDSADANTTFESGEDPTFSLGNLTNTDSDVDSEYVVIEFNALVENVVGNQNPGTLDNQFTVSADDITTVGSNILSIDLVEPQIEDLQQQISLNGTDFADNLAVDGQDLVTFQVTFSNTGNSDAFNVNLTNTLPAGLENLAVTDINLGEGITGATDNSNTSDLDVIIEQIPVGGSLTVTYTANVVEDISPDFSLTNDVNLTYSSLPDTGDTDNPTGSTTPNVAGAATGARDGSGGATGDLNNYAISDSVNLNSTSLVPVKSLVETSEASTSIEAGASNSDADLTIGEIARYRLAVEIPEGSTENLQITDLLPEGLRYLDDGTSKVAFVSQGGLTSNTVTGANLNAASLAVTPEVDLTATDSADADSTFESGEDPTFSLGNLTNTDNDQNKEYVVIEFNAVVENIPGNQDPGTLENQFAVTADNANSANSNIISLDLVEPSISNILKTADTEQGDAGDTVTFTVTYTNEGNSTAFDVRLLDEPVSTNYTNLQIIDVTSNGTLSNLTSDSNDTKVDETLASVAPGETITLTYTADLADALNPGDVADNTVDLTYSSLPGTGADPNPTGSTVAEERDGSDGAGDELNNYAANSSDSVTIHSYSLGSSIFEDLNNNGLQDDGEPGITSVTIQLFDAEGNEIPVGADGILGTADDGLGGIVSDADGNYFFSGLTPGDYQVVIPESNFDEGAALAAAPFSSIESDPADNGEDGDNNGIQADSVGTLVTSPVINLSAGDEPTAGETLPNGSFDDGSNDANGDMTIDFGFFGYGTITGNVAEGTDSDPQGDVAISGVLLTLFDSDGNSIDTTITDANGDYSFGNLLPGDYTIEQTQPDGLVSIAENEGGSDGDAGNNALDNTIAVTITSAETDAGNNFVEGALSLGSTVFTDVNNNGLLDVNETGIENVLVQLFDTNGNEIPVGADGILNTVDDAPGGVVTNANGNYFFDGLAPGEYQVVIPESNFEEGNALENTPFSSADTIFIDNSTDNDNNGIQSAGRGTEVVSPNITLEIGAETNSEFGLGSTQDDARNANGDMTIDFGFVGVAEFLNMDYGDAPDSLSATLSASNNLIQNGNEIADYRTRAEDDGPAHIIDPNLKLGNNIDADGGEFHNADANADDFNGLNDDDGVIFPGMLENYNISEYSVDVDVTNNTTEDATLIGWIDFDNDGLFEANEAVSQIIAAGSGQQIVTLEWTGLSGVARGFTYGRFRVSTDSSFDTIDDSTSYGLAQDGEVEDYLVCIAD